MRRPLLMLLAPLLLAPAACAQRAGGANPGGPVTPTPIDLGPSAGASGNTMPTGIVVNGRELVLYVIVVNGRPKLHAAVRDTAGGRVDNTVEGFCTAGTDSDDQNPFFGLSQCVAADGSLVEFGAYTGAVSRITSQADGTSTDATFARWADAPPASAAAGSAPAKAPVTVFWLRRHGRPAPSSIEITPGRTSPHPAARYPRITVYSPNGKAVASANLRPGVVEHPVGG